MKSLLLIFELSDILKMICIMNQYKSRAPNIKKRSIYYLRNFINIDDINVKFTLILNKEDLKHYIRYKTSYNIKPILFYLFFTKDTLNIMINIKYLTLVFNKENKTMQKNYEKLLDKTKQ